MCTFEVSKTSCKAQSNQLDAMQGFRDMVDISSTKKGVEKSKVTIPVKTGFTHKRYRVSFDLHMSTVR